MAFYCDFHGSYYDQAPWTHQPCMAETQVPEGCPVHFVTGAPINPQNMMAYTVASNGTQTDTPNTATLLGSDVRSFSLPDEFSCDCALTGVAISFDRYAIDLPAARAGENVRIWGVGFESGPLDVTITAAGACPTPEWPTDYSVALACDRCPIPPDQDEDGDGIPDDQDPDYGMGGCAVGGDPSILLVGLALVPLVRRRLARR